MIKTKKWRDAKAESSVEMCLEDWMVDEIDGLREELTEVYRQRAEMLEALQMTADYIDGPTSWTQAEEDVLRERLYAAITKAEAETGKVLP